MLVLSRKESEAVVICDEDPATQQLTLRAVVMVVECRGMGRVRIGFHYDQSVKVYRVEMTELDGMPIKKLCALPIGTPVKLKPQAVA